MHVNIIAIGNHKRKHDRKHDGEHKRDANHKQRKNIKQKNEYHTYINVIIIK